MISNDVFISPIRNSQCRTSHYGRWPNQAAL